MNNSNAILKSKNKGGRPKLSVDNLRSCHTNLALTKREYSLLKRAASIAKLPLSIYIREMSLNGKITLLHPDFLNEIKAFNRLSSNVNQLVKHANFGHVHEFRNEISEIENAAKIIKTSMQKYIAEV